MWVSLSSACNVPDKTLPCKPRNGLFLIKATAPGPKAYSSCWTGGQIASVPYELEVNGETTFNAGNVSCCPQGGIPGQTNAKQVNFKVTFDGGITSPYARVSGLESLSHPCAKETVPINVTITLPGLIEYKSNYTLPLLRCQVEGQISRSLSVTTDDIVFCSIDMPGSVKGLSCLQNTSSTALLLSVSCPDTNSTSHEIELNVSKKFNVSMVTHPGCAISFRGMYRPRCLTAG